jgi:hypothetical protein
MATFTSAQVGLSYPKRRETMTLIVPINRTDSSTPKCALPKDAVVCGLHVYQAAAAVTGAATFNLGWSGATTALINAFSMPTSTVGLANSGAATGASFLTKLDTDKQVIATYAVGTSTAGGTGYVIIEFFIPGGQEGVDD